MEIAVITITEERLRNIIRDEVQRAVAPYPGWPEYKPAYPTPTYPGIAPGLPQVWCGTAINPSDNSNQIVINDAT